MSRTIEIVASGYDVEHEECRTTFTIMAVPRFCYTPGAPIRLNYTYETRAAYPAAGGRAHLAPSSGCFTVCPNCAATLEIKDWNHAEE